MCGIAGLVATDGLPPDAAARAVAMRDVMRYRGPDGEGLYTDGFAALAHRRLSIVDLSTGQQPLANEDDTVWTIFNGEIYNHAELRGELRALGHRYRTQTDTETIVHAFEQWGEECVHRFRGMFAFALWDGRDRRLLLVRDRLGVKPLYWARAGGTLLFASEIKSLLASGLVVPEAETDLVPELLGTRYVSSERTLFRGIYKLLPGHLLAFENGRVTIRQYWDVPVGDTDPARDRHDVVARFRELLNESVRLRLMSDVPLGMFLSGGIDSSAIAALMARMIDRPLQTFSVAFADRAFSELDYAREVGRAIGAEMHEVVIDDRDFFDALPRLLWHEDEPIAHPSSVPLYFVSELARRHVKVVLTGEGSDELLAGYGKYPRMVWNWRAGAAYERLLPAAIRSRVASSVATRVPGRVGRYTRRSFLAMPRTPAAMCFDTFAAVPIEEQRRLLTPAFQASVSSADPYESSTALFHAPNGRSTFLDRVLYADIKSYLVELLMKQDQMSMAASVESRVPFLDHKVVEFAAGLPPNWKLAGWTTKRVLREAMAGVLPASILRRPKMGFPVPFGSWMRGRWNAVAADVLLDRRSRDRGILETTAVAALLRDHAEGRIDASSRIWSLANLELWFRTFIDGDGVQTLPAAAPQGTKVPSRAAREATFGGAVVGGSRT